MFILVRQINCSLSSCHRRGIISVWGIIVITFRIGKKKYRIRVSQRKFGSQNLYRDEKTIFLFD
jgi:hypothetical protein